MNYKHDRRKSFAPALLALALLVNLALPAASRATPRATPDSPNPKTISIAEARSLPLGTVVTVDGSITVPSGAFNSSTFDQGFAIQDHTGGIYVSTPDNLGFAPRQSASSSLSTTAPAKSTRSSAPRPAST